MMGPTNTRRAMPYPSACTAKIRIRRSLFLSVYLLIGVLLPGCADRVQEATSPGSMNILLIVADDLGYADLGCYGGDIRTPNIDALAARGVRFSRFHTAVMCAPTRAMLLSGTDHHLAGMGIQGFRSEAFGYEGRLTDRIIPIPELLGRAGYHTYMAGKWHLGSDPHSNPSQKGFERSFVNLGGAGSHYTDTGFHPSLPVTRYTEDGEAASWTEGNYTTDFYTDKLLEYMISNQGDGRPFFSFAAFTSPHWPLQVDSTYWHPYRGRYDEGYEALKASRLESLKEAGMIPEDAALPPSHPRVKPWDSLSPDQQREEARKMELYAGMVANLDYNVGRLVDYLKESGQYDHTLIVFMSDNGAAAEDFYYQEPFATFIQPNYDNSYENMGKPDSFVSYGPQWAEAGSAPFRYFKGFTTEGGIVAPMMIAGPGVEQAGSISEALVTVLDLAPTFYDLADVRYPDALDGVDKVPLRGTSLLPLLSGAAGQAHDPEYVYGLEHQQRGMVRKGNWKLTHYQRPFDEANFGLYNLGDDLAEQRDLKDSLPETYQDMLSEWHAFIGEIQANLSGVPGEDMDE